MIPAQTQVQAPYHAQPLPQAAAAEDQPGCNTVAQLQSQIDSLQAHLFHHAVARQMALSFAEHNVGAPRLADVNEFRNKQVKRFKEVYEMIPARLAECLLGDVQQHVTRFIYSQPWEIENIESLRWMLAVESVVGELFPAIFSATSENTTAETPSTCALSYSLAPRCSADVQPIETDPPSSTAKSCSAMPSDCSAADVVPDSDFSCIAERSDPGIFCAADCVSLEGELTAQSWTCRFARRKVSPRCNLRSRLPSVRLAGSRRHRLRPRLCPLPRGCAGFVLDWLSCMSHVLVYSHHRPRSVVPRRVRLARDLRSRPRCKMRCYRLSPTFSMTRRTPLKEFSQSLTCLFWALFIFCLKLFFHYRSFFRYIFCIIYCRMFILSFLYLLTSSL